MSKQTGSGMGGALDTSSTELNVLLADYQAMRDDDRTTTNSQAVLGSVFVALLAGLFAILVGDCRFRNLAPGVSPAQANCYELDVPVYIVAPALPFAVLGYIVMVGMQATIKSFYLRAVENEIRKFVGRRLEAIPEVTAVSGMELLLFVTSPRRGRRGYRALMIFLTISLIISIGSWVLFVAIKLDLLAKVLLAVLYGPLLLLIIWEGLAANTGGRRLLRRAALNLAASGAYPNLGVIGPKTVPRRLHERSYLSYFLFPRPLDIVKWLFIPIALAVGYLHGDADPTVRVPLLWATVVWLVFEYLIYQSRYQWNDIRGLADDLDHPARQERGRLPVYRFGPGGSVAASAAVILLKTGLAIVCSLVLPVQGLAGLIWVSLAAVWSLAVVYEILRAGAGAPKVRAATIWVVVGAGYAIRIALGLILSGLTPGENGTWPFICFVAAGWAFGIVFVTLTWVLEATGHCLGILPGPLYYADSADPRPEVSRYRLERKPHLFHLLVYLGITARRMSWTADIAHMVRAERERPLASATPLVSPWNLALILAVGLGVVGGLPTSVRPSWVLPVAFIAGTFLLTTVVTLARGIGARWSAVGAVSALAAVAITVTVGWPQGFPSLVVLIAFLSVYAGFRQSSYSDLKDFAANLKTTFWILTHKVVKPLQFLLRKAIGAKTWDLITGRLK